MKYILQTIIEIMFKPKKKINENAVKKDFFKVVKKEKGVDYDRNTYINFTNWIKTL